MSTKMSEQQRGQELLDEQDRLDYEAAESMHFDPTTGEQVSAPDRELSSLSSPADLANAGIGGAGDYAGVAETTHTTRAGRAFNGVWHKASLSAAEDVPSWTLIAPPPEVAQAADALAQAVAAAYAAGEEASAVGSSRADSEADYKRRVTAAAAAGEAIPKRGRGPAGDESTLSAVAKGRAAAAKNARQHFDAVVAQHRAAWIKRLESKLGEGHSQGSAAIAEAVRIIGDLSTAVAAITDAAIEEGREPTTPFGLRRAAEALQEATKQLSGVDVEHLHRAPLEPSESERRATFQAGQPDAVRALCELEFSEGYSQTSLTVGMRWPEPMSHAWG